MFSSKRVRKNNEIACIFVHAGAGFHSVQNENIHLQACNDAAKAAMLLMRNGGSSVDAVEIAVKVLEDREITNAGYGSNLTMDGVVECDAVVVDHYGRSGAAGAVAQIRNPVSLARLMLDHTTQTLSLRRVPPNLLVGQGATDFAYEHGMPILPLDYMVSPAARDRWRKWRDDLNKAEQKRRDEEAGQYGFSPESSQMDLMDYYNPQDEREQMRRAHTQAMKAGVWNEAQPISPPPSDNKETPEGSSFSTSASSVSVPSVDDGSAMTNPGPPPVEYSDPLGPPSLLSASQNPFANSTQRLHSPTALGTMGPRMATGLELTQQRRFGSEMSTSGSGDYHQNPPFQFRPQMHPLAAHDGSSGSESDITTVAVHGSSSRTPEHVDTGRPGDAAPSLPEEPIEEEDELFATSQTTMQMDNISDPSLLLPAPKLTGNGQHKKEDVITDTVGAIAIDMYGNIACAASSGGISMKHRGRCGPAALVGIGAAVIPVDDQDFDRTTVATVTSGTGEHMGTTMAAQTCSERIYQNIRKVPGGGYEECGDDEAINAFITKDFMGHPSVKQSHSTGAIGILSVKKDKDGAYLYFGHNTDSFALASMHSDEAKPVCTMSRSKGNGVIAQGGRGIRFRRRKS